MLQVNIHVTKIGTSESGKTNVYKVESAHGDHPILGYIKWHGPWRRYVFEPEHKTLYDNTCLIDIASSCLLYTNDHYKALAEKN